MNGSDFDNLPNPSPRHPASKRKITSRSRSSGSGSVLAYVVGFGVLLTASIAISVVGFRSTMRNAEKSVHNQIVGDAIRQFQIVCQTNPDAFELSMRAGVVAEAYLMAKDADNYKTWKDLADTIQKSAGKLSDEQVRKLVEPFAKLKLD